MLELEKRLREAEQCFQISKEAAARDVEAKLKERDERILSLINYFFFL